MKRHTHLIIPMAGEGTRYKNAGYDLPKPLIEFDGKPLFMSAMEGLKSIYFETKTFVVRKEHIEKYHIDEEILNHFPDAIIIAIEQTTRGAAETVFFAVRNLILSNLATYNDSIVIADCDVKFKAVDWARAIRKNSGDGVFLTFSSTSSKYSYLRLDGKYVAEVKEKDVISSLAITAPYFVKKIEWFVDAFHALERDNKDSELYMSLIYKYLIDDGKKMKAYKVDEFIPLGTPEELEEAIAND